MGCALLTTSSGSAAGIGCTSSSSLSLANWKSCPKVILTVHIKSMIQNVSWCRRFIVAAVSYFQNRNILPTLPCFSIAYHHRIRMPIGTLTCKLILLHLTISVEKKWNSLPGLFTIDWWFFFSELVSLVSKTATIFGHDGPFSLLNPHSHPNYAAHSHRPCQTAVHVDSSHRNTNSHLVYWWHKETLQHLLWYGKLWSPGSVNSLVEIAQRCCIPLAHLTNNVSLMGPCLALSFVCWCYCFCWLMLRLLLLLLPI